ncbi:hypothetical protein COY87_02430 [Candidatus Roizmanbacteria bacterium CG_4_10_14_0_8_um_filter_33_9]|uniref:Uncharacterized protein n=1 Tax=Candidatus Roizmanbacteria bacterium CG_4_10_14_0_8_um_filter_33_9 TaxID=1974826 RepID=A0A2M7QIM8_9BACT|nr:MAG: hypothetical protein COY87_02430 [Candidatus Roizmanbacteria bacterium CG_4_10_14_0_8_um_filter_33_9]
MLTNDDLQAIQQIVKKEISIETKPIKKELQKLGKDLDLVISTFDNDITDAKLRVARIEDHLHLKPFTFG